MAQLSQPVSTLHAAEDLTRAYILQLEGLALQLQYAKQLSVRSYDNGGQAHRDCAHTHGEIKPPADEKTSRDWNGYQVISGRPNEILDHFFVSSAGKLDCRDNVARVTTHEYDSGGFNRYVGARTYCDSYIGRRQRWCGRGRVGAVASLTAPRCVRTGYSPSRREGGDEPFPSLSLSIYIALGHSSVLP